MARRTPKLENRGSLISCKDGDSDRCLGYLFHSPENGTYEPTFGRVDVTPDEADIHSKLLSQAEIAGLDERCEIGQGGVFYLRPGQPPAIGTWIAELVSADVMRHGKARVIFRRGSKVFRGRVRGDVVCFERIT